MLHVADTLYGDPEAAPLVEAEVPEVVEELEVDPALEPEVVPLPHAASSVAAAKVAPSPYAPLATSLLFPIPLRAFGSPVPPSTVTAVPPFLQAATSPLRHLDAGGAKNPCSFPTLGQRSPSRGVTGISQVRQGRPPSEEAVSPGTMLGSHFGAPVQRTALRGRLRPADQPIGPVRTPRN